MVELRIVIDGWEDGERVERELDEVDRWQLQGADVITVHAEDVQVRLHQKPRDLKTLGVGALIWEGAMILAQHMLTLPGDRFHGSTCVELGAGLGLCGILAHKKGAKKVTLTDVGDMLPTMERNVKENQEGGKKGKRCLVAEQLEWGSSGAPNVIESLTKAGPIDYVLASDFMYPETEGLHGDVNLEAGHPAATAFFDVAEQLCTPGHTKCLLAFEVRGDWMVGTFMKEAKARFKKVKCISGKKLPEAYQKEHIKLYQLTR